jgi:hypothetical protein
MAVAHAVARTVEDPGRIEVRPASEPPSGRLRTASVVVVYVVLGVLAYRPLVASGGTHLFGTSGDSILATWFLAWIPHAAAHGLDPFFSNAMYVPTGINLAQNTASPLLGALTVPFSSVLGPVWQANLLMLLAMPVSASAAYFVLRRWDVWWPAAALGGLIYGFSPYMVGQGLGHLVLVFAPWPPIIALVLGRIVEGQGSTRRNGSVLGLLVVAQFLTEPEVMAMVAVVATVALVAVALAHPAGRREMVRRLAAPLAIAVALAAVLLAFPVWMILAGPEHYSLPAQGAVNPYLNDALSFVVPGPLQRVSFGLSSVGHRLVAGNLFETGGYLGVPLLVAGGALTWRSRRRGRTRVALLCFVTSLVFSLGAHLSIDGHLTSFPLPFLLLAHVPLLDNILAVRFSLLTAGSLAALLAFGLDDVRRVPSSTKSAPLASSRRARSRRRTLAALGLVTLVGLAVLTWLPRWPVGNQRVPVLPTAIERAVPNDDPIALTYPFADSFDPSALGWQLTDGFRFRLLGGRGEHPETVNGYLLFPARMHPDGLQRFLNRQEGSALYGPAPARGPGLTATTRATLAAYHVRLVIVDRSVRGSAAVVGLFTAALGPPQVSSGSFVAWSSTHGDL